MSLGLKVTPEIKNSLDTAAKENGRTQSQEAEVRLERSFEQQQLLDQVFDLTYRNPHLVALLLSVGEAARDTLAALGEPDKVDLFNNPDEFEEIARALQQVTEAYRPVGELKPESGGIGQTMARRTIRMISEDGTDRVPTVSAIRRRIPPRVRIGRLRPRHRWYSHDGRIGPAPEEVQK